MFTVDKSAVTDRGRELLNQGAALNFTSVKVGDGTYTSSEDIASRTALKNTLYSYTPSSITTEGTSRTLKVAITNYDPVTEQAIVTATFTMREVGIYVTVNGVEELFAICVSYTGDSIPAYNGTNKAEMEMEWVMNLSGASSVTVTVTGAAALASDFNLLKAAFDGLGLSVVNGAINVTYDDGN